MAARGSALPSSVAVLSAAMAMAAVVGWEQPRPGGRRLAAIVATSVVVLFGAAVIYLGVHWTTDVLVGWTLGALVGLAAVPAGRVLAGWLQRIAPNLFAFFDRYATDSALASDAVVDAEKA